MSISVNLFRHTDDFQMVTTGYTIFKEGEQGDNMYVVIEGEVELRVRDKPVETLGVGDIFGEMALIDTQPRSATAVAKSDCKLAPVNERRFNFLVQNTPSFSLQVMRIMANRLRRLNRVFAHE